ncbi:MAG: TonB-dependent receptor [Alphaproteobacteria bacterium]|nr:MAG: TonB-dependent receptor [Alphaproteobacteria bacterium]
MKNLLRSGAGLIALCASASATLAEPTDKSEAALVDMIVVTGPRMDDAKVLTIKPEMAPFEGTDVTHLIARTPGGGRIANGELSGQVAYRGLFGERLNLRVDGQRFASGGPNMMDPAFHYAPPPLIAAIKIDRGVSPVSEGPGLAGGVDAIFKRIDFDLTEAWGGGYDVSLSTRTVDESLSMGGIVGAANERFRFNLLGAYEEGDDTEFSDGIIGGSGFQRGVYGLVAGAKLGGGTLSLDMRRQNTGPSGNPPFPMDIVFVDTDFARLSYEAPLGEMTLKASVNYTDVSHLMDNHTQRPAPAMMMTRDTYADATTHGGQISLTMPAWGGDFKLGMDSDQADHNSRITNPYNAEFYVGAFPKISIDRLGGFAQWTGKVGGLNAELGLRVDSYEARAGEATTGPAVPEGAAMLASSFNARGRTANDTTYDVVARVWTQESKGLSWRATLARKENAPGYIQRFAWLPTPASGGLADGNTYVGDVALNPETAWIVESGFDYASQDFYLRPTIFWRQIDHYIQGVPYDDTPGIIDSTVEMVSDMNGDPTPLTWSNVNARLYGFDVDGGYDFAGPLRLDGVLSYVRGERRDIDDNLYRIAPPSLMLGLTWENERWSATLEARAVARQHEVSVTNSEARSPAYATASLYGDVEVKEGVRLSMGIENLFDTHYRDHLSGYNRNGYGDVPLGERLPGAGRGLFLRLSLAG